MKVSVICADVSDNCFGRAFILAKMLEPLYEVNIIGPAFGDGIWEPLRVLCDVPCDYVPCPGRLNPYFQLHKLIRLIDGDVIYASKPLATSYLIALVARKKRPVVLDIDDWEMGFIKGILESKAYLSRMKYIFASAAFLYKRLSCIAIWLANRLIPFASQITVSNSFLQQRYGGAIIYHGRDASDFNPCAWDVTKLRKKHGIDPSTKVVMFFGTPRQHKGVEDLIQAMSLFKDRNALLMLVGLDENDAYCKKLTRFAQATLGQRFKGVGMHPFSEVSAFMALSDVVVVPQRDDASGCEQMPAKVFDAMAMGKPIVATKVSDLPYVLENCGWLVESSNPRALYEAIAVAITDKMEAGRRAEKARARFLEKYSWEAITPQLHKIFEVYESTTHFRREI